MPVVLSGGGRSRYQQATCTAPAASEPIAARLVLHNARHPLLERNLKAKGAARRSHHHRTRRRAPATRHHRPKHRRKNCHPENRRPAGADGAIRHSRSRRSRRAARSSTPCWPISATTSRSSRIFRRSPRTSPTSISSRAPRQHDSLVLLDELGSATDPEEGAALAVAIAEHFRRHRLHHRHLHPPHFAEGLRRQYAGVVNASVGFDEATLQPTYELKIGVPGASAGINIAQRLGLNPSIIESPRDRSWARRRATSANSSTACTRNCAKPKPNACA